MPDLLATVVVANVESAERYLLRFEVECWNSARTTLISGPLTVEGVWDSAEEVWKQKNPLFFRGLIRGTTYSFRARVTPQAGGPPSDWSAWADETAGDTTAPAPTYSAVAVGATGGVIVYANPASAPSDISHYEVYWNNTGDAPTSDTLPNHSGSPNGQQLMFVLAPSEVVYVWIRAVDTSGNRQAWTSLGNFTEGLIVPPTAVASATPTSGSAPLSVTFTGSGSSTVTGATISEYRWEFGDGNTSLQADPSHQYASDGNYTARLTVRDTRGLSRSASVNITVGSPGGNNPPVADISATPTFGVRPLDVDFDASGSSDSDGTVDRYDWDFGDGNGAQDAGATVSHRYIFPGVYTATVTVTDDDGATDSAQIEIEVENWELP